MIRVTVTDSHSNLPIISSYRYHPLPFKLTRLLGSLPDGVANRTYQDSSISQASAYLPIRLSPLTDPCQTRREIFNIP